MQRGEKAGCRRRHRRPGWEALRLDSFLPQRVRVTLHTHTLADFLLYGLYRTDRFDVGVSLDLSEIPPVRNHGHFPQYIAVRGAESPADLPALVEEYYRGEELARFDVPLGEMAARVLALAPHYAEYLPFWRERVLPLESQILDGWREQLNGGETLDLFQRITRLRWPFTTLRLYACYHHPSGSALTPYPCLFSTLFDPYAVEPSAPWFLGHEGIHVLLDAVGWWEHPEAPAVVRWMGGRYLAEEALCLLIQNRLSTICGLLPEAEMQVLPCRKKHLRVYHWLQAHWEEYLEDPARYPTIVEYLVTGLQEVRRRRQEGNGRYAPIAPTARAA